MVKGFRGLRAERCTMSTGHKESRVDYRRALVQQRIAWKAGRLRAAMRRDGGDKAERGVRQLAGRGVRR